MESSWRQNLIDYGLGAAGATLCARVVTVSTTEVITNAEDGSGLIDWWLILPDTAGLAYFHFPVSAPKHGRFPYGVPVLPDVLV